MAKKEKKTNIKVTEIPSKIKEIKVIGKDESGLEKEVEESKVEFEEFRNFAPSGNFQAPILKSESPEQISERPITVEQTRNDSEFSQSRIYATTGQQPATPTERDKRYDTQKDMNRRFNLTLERNDDRINLNQQSSKPRFVSQEPGGLGGNEKDKSYISPADIQSDRPRRKYPWEV